MTYLSQALLTHPDVELIGVRVCKGEGSPGEDKSFGWPIVDLPLGKKSVSTLFWRQKERFRQLVQKYRPDVVHAQGVDVEGLLVTGCGLPCVVTVHGLIAECARQHTNVADRFRGQLTSLLTERRTVRRATDLIAISSYVTLLRG